MTTQANKLLLIEDNPGDARLVQEALAEIPEMRFELSHCDTLAQGVEFLAKNTPDIILVDLGLPDAEGLEVVRNMHDAAPEIPLVVLTVVEDDALPTQALRQGAQDYLVKSQINKSLLWRSLRYAMERQRMQMERLTLSLSDDLTGLYNRRGFMTLCEHHIKLARRLGKPFLIAFVDLDGMKYINDTFGHQEGDRALVDAANVLRDSFRQSDIVARLGGDEFVVFAAGASKEHVESISGRIEQKLRYCNANPGRRYELSFSIGFVQSDANSFPGIEQLLSQADTRMYEQKLRKRASREFTEAGSGPHKVK